MPPSDRPLLDRSGAQRAAAIALFAVGFVITAQYAIQFQTRSFLVWRYDADTRDLLERARTLAPTPATAAVSWQFEPSTDFYRVTKNWQWLKPVYRESLQMGGDFYLILPNQEDVIQSLRLKVVARGPVSGAVLCTR